MILFVFVFSQFSSKYILIWCSRQSTCSWSDAWKIAKPSSLTHRKQVGKLPASLLRTTLHRKELPGSLQPSRRTMPNKRQPYKFHLQDIPRLNLDNNDPRSFKIWKTQWEDYVHLSNLNHEPPENQARVLR